MKRKTTEEFIKESRSVHGDKYDYSKVFYKNNKEKACIICPKHGEFWQSPQDHLKGHGCSKCNGGVSHSNEEWLDKFFKTHGNLYDYSLISNNINKLSANAKIPILCEKHGVFYQSCMNHSLGQGCPKCADEKNGIKKRHTKNIFVELSIKMHGHKYDYSKVEYVNNSTEVCIICSQHGEFWQKPNVHLLGHGCPKCSSSLLENEIIKLLDENSIKYEHRAKKHEIEWLGRLELDFYLPQYNVAIECQGLEHFQPIAFFGGEKKYKSTIKRDEYKRKLCEKNGVKLLYYSNLKIKYPYEVFENKNKLLKEIINEK